jgi:Uma2 family endonuclease
MSTVELIPPPASVSINADQLFKNYGGKRCQLIDGKVEMMSPAGFGHGALAARVIAALAYHAERKNLGFVVGSETGFRVASSPDTVLAPDAAFIRKNRVEAVGVVETYFPEAPALAVEVTSPSDTAEEVDDKARRWLAAGCEMVWVVYPRGRSVTVYRSLQDVKIVTGDGALDGADVVPGFSLPLAELFAGLGPA